MDDWIIDYDGALYLKMSEKDFIKFQTSSFYKIRLRRYVKDSFDGFVRFEPSLTYLDYKKIISLCEKEAYKKEIILNVSQSLKNFIANRDIYIQTRYKVGNEIKTKNNKYYDKFIEYKDNLENLMSRKLREKQLWDSFFMCLMKKSGNFSVPGSGKTSSVLGMYAYLKNRDLVKKIIVICPKNAFGSWIDEFNICFDGKEELFLFNVHSEKYKNKDAKVRAIKYDSGKSNLLLFNYECIKNYREEIEDIIDDKTLLVYDEVHKAKQIDGVIGSNPVTQTNIVAGKWLSEAICRLSFCQIFILVRYLTAISNFFVSRALCALFVFQETERTVHCFGYTSLRCLEHMGIAV